ncbi:hypothetical protein B7494_g2723 [Chlorociboria aeruginascens]|nr:hypothetical protein B7494_g2723 [Chlorociboria aeruginascens]
MPAPTRRLSGSPGIDLRSATGEVLTTDNLTAPSTSATGDLPAVGGDKTLRETPLSQQMSTKGVKRKHGARKNKTAPEPITGGWDVLPHGMGRAGDLADDNFGTKVEALISPPPKRVKGRFAKKDDEDSVMLQGDLTRANKPDEEMHVKQEGDNKEELEVKNVPHDHAKKTNRKAPESSSNKRVDPVTTELLQETVPNRPTRKGKRMKSQITDEDVKDEDFQEKPKKARTSRTKVATSEEVLDKVNDLVDAAKQAPNKSRKTKAHPYGLTPGESPFPEFAMPTPEACEEVNRLLSELHGEVKPPDVIPPPSMDVAGCGEVPDLLDAILRTLLSASTTANNANLSLAGLKDKFGLRTSGNGEGSVNWEKVHKADLPTVIDAIKKGGLAKVKGTNIKKILDSVYEQNRARRDALRKERETGKPANITGAEHETQEQKDAEMSKTDENMLSMDHIFEMTTDEAMDEMTKLPGIGVKTASCVILFCMQRPSFAVDTHVWRHCKWLGWVPEKATRDQTFSHCEVRIPDHLKYPLHQLFLRHGKTCGRCKANTSAGTQEWENTDCPIDHLVTRTENKKLHGKKGKKDGESEVEMADSD